MHKVFIKKIIQINVLTKKEALRKIKNQQQNTLSAEAAARRCSVKKVFFNDCFRDTLIIFDNVK